MEVVTDRYTPEGKRFMKELEELGKLQVRVGYKRAEGVHEKNADEDLHEENGAQIIDVAVWNELGTSTGIDSRPFMRDSVDKHMPELNRFMEEQAVLLSRGVTAEQILKNIGIYQQEMIQKEIADGSFKPNADSTIKKKKSAKPLIDTGQMQHSANFFICRKGEYD